MKRRLVSVTLALIAAFAIAGCGEDNNCNCDNGPVPTIARTSTPGPVATPTVAQSVGTTPTTGGSPGPTATPTGGGQCEGDSLIITITTNPGSDLDTGWTGIAHNSVAVEESSVSTNLNGCGDGLCDVDGSALVGTKFGSPLPLSSGGVPVCVINTFREAVTGTYDCASGCGESAVKITSQVFLVQDIAKPCPTCVGDPTPNDGQKGGTCDGGTTPGAACEVGGISPVFGSTSNDCLPTGSSVGELAIDLSPITTGAVSVQGNQNCVAAGVPDNCYCPGQNRGNACDSGICPASHVCEGGPIDAFCSNQKFRSCTPGTGTQDCDDFVAGSGTCIDSPRPCFGDTISAQGVCGTQSGTLVSFFCIPQTRAPAINTTAGLPGPGIVTLPVRSVRVPR